jgi:hypothetical protein
MTAPLPSAPTPRRAGVLATVKAVAASFFGVRSRRHHEQDIARLDPRVVIVTGLVLAGAFVMALVLIVRMVVPA